MEGSRATAVQGSPCRAAATAAAWALIWMVLPSPDAVGASRADAVVIIDAGRSNYEIVVDAAALPTTRLAAQELQLYLRLATEVTLPIVHVPTVGKSQVRITSSNQLPPHGFSISVNDGTIRIVGRDSAGLDPDVDYLDPVFRGTCNGVYEFLERFVGVRWYWSDELGRIVPRMSRVALPADFSIEQKPFFEYRALDYGPAESYLGSWARYNRMGSAYTVHHSHTLQEIVPVAEWAEKRHPEYAAMRGDRRRTERQHVCTSNEKVVAIVAAAAESLFRHRPDRTMFAISPPDGDGLCMCPDCTHLDVPGYLVDRADRRNHPVLTDRMLHFYNEVADRVRLQFPDRLLSGYVYMDYQYPPRRENRVAPNLALFLAPNTAMESWDEDSWALTQSLYRFWGAFHDRVYAHDIGYLFTRGFGLPAPLGDRAADFLRLMAEAKIKGCYLYIAPTWEAFGSDAYVWARMLWNPHVDVEEIRAAYFRDLYGTAAEPVRRYFDTAAECARRMSDTDAATVATLAPAFAHSKAWARESLAGLVPAYALALDELESHLKDAEQAGGSDPDVVKRLSRLRDTQSLTVATIRGLQAIIAYETDPAHDPARLRDAASAIQARRALIERMGGTYGGALRKWLDYADKTVDFPLRSGGYYESLARK